jgi:CheY-like chemotaxis protein
LANILVIDDDALIRSLVRIFLESLGHTVDEAVDGERGIARVGKGGVDAVLLDVHLPRMHADEVIGGIRQESSKLPVLLFTGLLPELLDPKLLALPHTGLVRKPFTRAEIAAGLVGVGVA